MFIIAFSSYQVGQGPCLACVCKNLEGSSHPRPETPLVSHLQCVFNTCTQVVTGLSRPIKAKPQQLHQYHAFTPGDFPDKPRPQVPSLLTGQEMLYSKNTIKNSIIFKNSIIDYHFCHSGLAKASFDLHILFSVWRGQSRGQTAKPYFPINSIFAPIRDRPF